MRPRHAAHDTAFTRTAPRWDELVRYSFGRQGIKLTWSPGAALPSRTPCLTRSRRVAGGWRGMQQGRSPRKRMRAPGAVTRWPSVNAMGTGPNSPPRHERAPRLRCGRLHVDNGKRGWGLEALILIPVSGQVGQLSASRYRPATRTGRTLPSPRPPCRPAHLRIASPVRTVPETTTRAFRPRSRNSRPTREFTNRKAS
jgi:hypothetical protein